MFDPGDHVLADFGNHEPDKPAFVIAHVYSDAYENAAGETKYDVQAPDGSLHALAYREPPYGPEGSGGCFKAV